MHTDLTIRYESTLAATLPSRLPPSRILDPFSILIAKEHSAALSPADLRPCYREWQGSGPSGSSICRRTRQAHVRRGMQQCVSQPQGGNVSSIPGWATQQHRPTHRWCDPRLVCYQSQYVSGLRMRWEDKKNTREFEQHINLALMTPALNEPVHHIHHPGCALSARSALTA